MTPAFLSLPHFYATNDVNLPLQRHVCYAIPPFVPPQQSQSMFPFSNSVDLSAGQHKNQ